MIGISQRDVRSYYYHIDQQKEDIIIDIKSFFINNLKEKFFDSNCELELLHMSLIINAFNKLLVVIDVYRPNRGRVLLIDINPFGQSTDSLLFDWDELNAMRDDYRLEVIFNFLSFKLFKEIIQNLIIRLIGTSTQIFN